MALILKSIYFQLTYNKHNTAILANIIVVSCMYCDQISEQRFTEINIG